MPTVDYMSLPTGYTLSVPGFGGATAPSSGPNFSPVGVGATGMGGPGETWMENLARRRAEQQLRLMDLQEQKLKYGGQTHTMGHEEIARPEQKLQAVQVRQAEAQEAAARRPPQYESIAGGFNAVDRRFELPVGKLNSYQRQMYMPKDTQMFESQRDVNSGLSDIARERERKARNMMAGRGEVGSILEDAEDQARRAGQAQMLGG